MLRKRDIDNHIDSQKMEIWYYKKVTFKHFSNRSHFLE